MSICIYIYEGKVIGPQKELKICARTHNRTHTAIKRESRSNALIAHIAIIAVFGLERIKCQNNFLYTSIKIQEHNRLLHDYTANDHPHDMITCRESAWTEFYRTILKSSIVGPILTHAHTDSVPLIF